MFLLLVAPPAFALDKEHEVKGSEIARKAIAYLQRTQNKETGGWVIADNAPDLPGITAMALQGMLLEPGITTRDESVSRAAEYLLKMQRDDGSIYDGVLPAYNTSLAVSALAMFNDDNIKKHVDKAVAFIKNAQWSGKKDKSGRPVDETHPFYGGVGYGSHGRPDLSNLSIALQALHDAGVPGSDESFRRAVVFLQRTQMLDEVNDMPYADNSEQGGFIYSTSIDEDHPGSGESKAGTTEESRGKGRPVSSLRCYGSMTYAGFKSYIYADLKPDDPRVKAAFNWIRQNYTLAENPGMGNDGYYYYLVTMSKALNAAKVKYITPVDQENNKSEPHDWANDMIDRLAELQKEDGSFAILSSRWMEDQPILVTCYALLAVQYALGRNEN